ncbi:pentapeptide repeat-containing protein [Sorangium sp. So ce1335]|uniref:pentapeptide repeat-containing protein n=1 Tax=Sorangium sp. So ce1335 TaxID=3133335 RepID=UPI003F5E8AF4
MEFSATLLLAGPRSPATRLQATAQLELTLPDVRRVDIPGADHNAPDMHAPELVAAHLESFVDPAPASPAVAVTAAAGERRSPAARGSATRRGSRRVDGRMTARRPSGGIDVLIITALQLEIEALLALGDGGERGWQEAYDPSGFRYHVREIPRDPSRGGAPLRVAAAWSGQMGEGAAAVRATHVVGHLDPACLAMCGICAGARGDVALGDVIVAQRVYSYDHGKLIATKNRRGQRSESLIRDIETYNLEKTWAMDAAYFARDRDVCAALAKERPRSLESQERWLLHRLLDHEHEGAPLPTDHPELAALCPRYSDLVLLLRGKGLLEKRPGVLKLTKKARALVRDERLRHPRGLPDDPPLRVHVGPIATGKTVREDPELFSRLRREVRKTLGAEMEAAAIGYVAEHLGRRSIIVKAVSDHGDHDKDDAFQAFAARASATFLLAFLQKHMPEQRAPAPPALPPPEVSAPAREGGRSDDFLSRVQRVCELHAGQSAVVERFEAPPPFGHYLRVSRNDGGIARTYPVAALDQPVSDEALDAFLAHIDARYRRDDSGMISHLIYRGDLATPALVDRAAARRVRLQSFVEYQGLIDFSRYLQWQTTRLENDTVYPPSIYIGQRMRVLDPEEPDEKDALEELTAWLGSPHGRFVVILGDFGTGKTFLLHELARRLGTSGGPVVPVLLEMRSLEKARSLDELVAQHLARSKMEAIRLQAFNFMLAEGRIALLFDGFDELALRVSYDRAAEHFDTLIQAAQGNAKVVVTSRSQHFLSDRQVRMALAERAALIQGHRLTKLLPFSKEQIRLFLNKRLGSEAAGEERLRLLDDVKDLLGLSANPRMLSFISEIDSGELKAARERAGEITSAGLYRLLIERWLKNEFVRANPRGAPPGLSVDQLRKAATTLAMLLWQRTERTLNPSELPQRLLDEVQALSERRMESGTLAHQIGSGTLLVRDEDGNFGFIHQSVLEWLVAREAATEVLKTGDSAALGVREMSDLMIDFFGDLAGPAVSLGWADAALRGAAGETAKKNALRMQARLRGEIVGVELNVLRREGVELAGHDLRGKDLSGQDLRGANLSGANLTDARLVEARLEGASLARATLVGADLTRAVLEGADLSGADLSGARLLGADLRGARLVGAVLRAAKLVGAQLDRGALDGLDAAGAALPDATLPVQRVTRSAPSCVALSWSNSGRVLASAHEDGAIAFWENGSGLELGRVVALEEQPRTLKFLPGDAALALWTGRSLLRCDVATGRVERLLVETHPALEAAIGPEALLAIGSSTEDIKLWSRWNVEPRGVPVGPVDYGEQLGRMVFSRDGRTLAIGAFDGAIHLWDSARSVPARALRGHEASVFDLAFNAEGTLLASGSADRTIRLWDVRAGEELKLFKGHYRPVHHVGLSPDGRWLVSVSTGDKIRLWDVGRGNYRMLHGHTKNVVSVEFSPDGTLLASASEDGTIRLWTVPGGLCVAVLVHLQGGWIAFSPDGRYKLGGDTTGAFWHEIGDCRFEPGELDPFLPFALRIPHRDPLFERSYPSPAPSSHEGPARAG